MRAHEFTLDLACSVARSSFRDRELHLPGQVGGFQVLHESLDHAYVRSVRPEPVHVLACSRSYSDPAGRPNKKFGIT
jgi:hypothetical protein